MLSLIFNRILISQKKNTLLILEKGRRLVLFNHLINKFCEKGPSLLILANKLESSQSYLSYLEAENTFQNLNVSSEDAEQTVDPSGDSAICKTLFVCPWSSVIFYIVG